MWALLVGAAVLAGWLVWWRRSGEELGPFVGLRVVVLFGRLWHGVRSNRPPPFPERAPAILVANHTCSADPAFLTTACRRPLSFLVAGEYYKIATLNRLFDYIGCVPVARNGRDAVAVRLALRRLHEKRVLVIFPEGGLSNAGRTRLRRGKGGAAFLALRSRVPVHPVLIAGGPETSDLLRSWVRPSRVRLVVGEAVDLTAFYDRPLDRRLIEEVTRLLMARIAALRARSPNGLAKDVVQGG